MWYWQRIKEKFSNGLYICDKQNVKMLHLSPSRSIWYFVVAVLSFTAACKSYEELDFFGVKTLKPVPGEQVGTLILSDSLFGLGSEGVETHGFYWSDDKKRVDQPDPLTPRIDLGQTNTNGSSQKRIQVLEPKKTYYFRAFAQRGTRFILAEEVESFSLGLSLSIEHDFLKTDNDAAYLIAQVRGLENLRTKATGHGWVWSSNNKTPSLDTAIPLEKGQRITDGFLTDTLRDLSPDTWYYVRFYLRTDSSTFYSPADSFKIKDVWRPGSQPFKGKAVWGAFHTTNGDRGYVGCGCTESEDVRDGRNCLEGNLVNEIWEFDPATQSWRQLPLVFPADFKRANATAFAIGNKLYIGLGGYQEPNYEQLYADLWELDLTTLQFTQLPDFPGRGRSDAVAFTLGDQGYVGAGRGIVNLNEAFFNDFYTFDPQSGWSPVDSLPLYNNNATFYDRGRKGAVAFSDGQWGYVAGGQYDIDQLEDCWIFDPATRHWKQGPKMPGSRQDATAFVIGTNAYWGLGWEKYTGFHNDWHVLNLKSPKAWQGVNPFRGTARADAFGFSLLGKGYLGSGRSVRVTGTGYEPLLTPDVWEYFPVSKF